MGRTLTDECVKSRRRTEYDDNDDKNQILHDFYHLNFYHLNVTDIAEACLFLASDKSRYITGASIEVTGTYFLL